MSFEKGPLVLRKVLGFKMYLYTKRSHGVNLILKGIYEPLTTKIVHSLLKEGNYFIDAGASIGYYTLIGSKLVGTKGRVIAIEPERSNFEILKKNVAINNCENVTLINKAVSERSGGSTLYLSHGRGSHSLSPLRRNLTGETVPVDTIRLDECVEKADVIKMDIEGWQYYALKGIEGLLNHGSLKIIMEYCPTLQSKIGLKQKLVDLLRNYSWDIYNIDEQKKQIYKIKDVAQLDKQTNLLLHIR
jgi:FkbM family methyltransferase